VCWLAKDKEGIVGIDARPGSNGSRQGPGSGGGHPGNPGKPAGGGK